ncbi:hypothetical protein O3M35_006425 [Rhynocoris fuscipes]|uniref:Uncharacterized protein n=1 Tax=Rhynocoris fuscipes TaxID=488301 RepID=A0AAW1DG14_9HEMI
MEKVVNEAKNLIYKMHEHVCKTELGDKINQCQKQNTLDIEIYKKELQEINLKIKYINQFKKVMNSETEVAAKLKWEEIADKLEPDMNEEIKHMKNELNHLQCSLKLKNFSIMNMSEQNEIVEHLNDMSNNMERIESHLSNFTDSDNNASLLFQIANKLNELDDIIQRCELEKEELDNYVLSIISLKIRLQKSSNPYIPPTFKSLM